VPKNRIYKLPADDNWWSPGDNGPCGPCSEMFYDMVGNIGDLTHEEFLAALKKETVIEIWNDVFMEYEKKDGKVVGKLKQSNVDTGAGLERITAVMQGKQTAYDTDIFGGGMDIIKTSQNGKYYDEKSARIVLDHIRTATLLISDNVLPGSKGQGYVLRKIIRKSKIEIDKLGMSYPFLIQLCQYYVSFYGKHYNNLENKNIPEIIKEEIEKFNNAWDQARQEIIRNFEIKNYDSRKQAEFVFYLEQSLGVNHEVSIPEIFQYQNVIINDEAKKILSSLIKEHQKLSQTASAGMFKGGLANHNDKTIRLHTAHHLLLAALQAVVSPDIKQRGSNITEERLRIDFLCDHKLTDEEKKQVEDMVNDKIKQSLNVVRREMPLAEAEKIGAQMEFGAKYPETVSVYFIEGSDGTVVSKEFCGGPHVNNTSELGHFKILKEEAVAAGIRRIKAVLE
jgi:alanyl-tRNA synthetase